MPDPVRPRILVVEDSPSDVALLREAFAQAGGGVEMTCIQDGDAAVPHLRRSAAEPPDLVLLDLNLPRCDGRAILAAMKSDVELRSISVFVLTTSASPEDVAHCYALGANCYIRKPFGYSGFVDLARGITGFWFTFAQRPR